MNGEIKKTVEDFLNRKKLLSSKNNFLVAFSGGMDSFCLLDVLNDLSKDYGFNVVAAHLNHNWRGEESLQEAKSCCEFCKQKNIEFYTETLPDNLPQTELEARNQRYEFFKRAAEKFNINAVFTGHTKTDNIETILYRIIKGTGLNGLKGIPEERKLTAKTLILRPLLCIMREETKQYCENRQIKYCSDSSNENVKYSRNKIRLNLIPELKTYNSNVENALLRLSQIACDAEEAIGELFETAKYIKDNEIVTKEFLKLSKVLKKRIMLAFLIQNSLDYSYEKIDEILNFIDENYNLKSGNTFSLTDGKWLFVSSSSINLINYIKSGMVKLSVEVDLTKETFYHAGVEKTLNIKKWQGSVPDKYPSDKDYKAFIDLSGIKEKLYFRTRQNGDKIQPLGMKEVTKLKKYLINKGVPEYKRDKLMVLATDTEILWVAGIGISEKIKVKNVPTHILEIKEEVRI